MSMYATDEELRRRADRAYYYATGRDGEIDFIVSFVKFLGLEIFYFEYEDEVTIELVWQPNQERFVATVKNAYGETIRQHRGRIARLRRVKG